MTAILQLYPISAGNCAPYRFLRQRRNLRTSTNHKQETKNTASFNQYAQSKIAPVQLFHKTHFFAAAPLRKSSIMSLSSSPLPPPSSSNTSTSTPTTMRVHNLKHHYSQLGKVSKALASSSSSSHQSSATSRMTGWEYEWQICKRADAAHQSHDFFTSVNNMHLNRYTDILASTFFLLCFCFVLCFVCICFVGQHLYLLWL